MSNNDKIYPAILVAMTEIGAIGKDKKNPQQGYNFRGIDDVLNSLQPALIKAKIFVVPRIMEMHREERASKAGGVLIYTTVRGEYDFISAEDGSKVTASTYGEGMDSSDKSVNKAMSGALKYAIIQTLAIPTKDMPDADAHTPEPKAKETKPSPKPEPPPAPSESKSPVEEQATQAQRKALFAKAMARWDSRDKAKQFADYLLEMAGVEHFSKHYISECIDHFDGRAVDFEAV